MKRLTWGSVKRRDTSSREKVDELVDAVIAAARERDAFDAIAKREVQRLQAAATRPFIRTSV